MLKQIRSLILLGLLGAVSASAQITNTVAVHVPFPFNAVNRTWAPGTYQLHINSDGIVVLRSSRNAQIFLARTFQTPEGGGGSYLEFAKYGNRWTLSEIVTDGTENEVPLGRLAREYMAHNRPANQNTEVAFDEK